MPRFVVEKLPPHWLFVPSKRQVRRLLADLGADVRVVEFSGTGRGRTAGRLFLGFIESRVVESGWRFYVRLLGVRETEVGTLREELAESALAEAGRYISTCITCPPSQITKPAQMLLSFRVGPEGLHPECRVKTVDRRSYPTGTWWRSEAPA